MKKLVILLFVGVLLSNQTVIAQNNLVPPPDGMLNSPPNIELPAEPTVGSGTRDSGSISQPLPGKSSAEAMPEPISSGDLQPGLQPYDSGNDYQIYDCQPALLESTGTWLRRGFWFSEVDVLLLDRVWRRNNFILAFQDNSGIGTIGRENLLVVEGGRTGAEAAPRLNVGRFLFRDHKNRDHSMEFAAFGGGQWSQSGRLDAANNGSLSVGFYNIIESDFGAGTLRLPLDRDNISFDGAQSTQYSYDSRFNSFELNYHVKSRMLKDRMELEPSGHWVRRAQPSISRSLLAGIRYFDLNEDFDWDAFDITNAAAGLNGDDGSYRVRTDNDLIGTQVGFSWNYENARWSLGLQNKTGMFINRTNVDSSFTIANGPSGDNDSTVDNLSFLVEGALLAKWHLRPNFSLRAGMEILYVSSVAHASEQLDFIPVSRGQTAIVNGDSTFMGGLIGFEGYW